MEEKEKVQDQKQEEGQRQEEPQNSPDYEKVISDLKAQIQSLQEELKSLKEKPEETQKEESELERKVKELENLKAQYQQEKIRNAILQASSDAVDPEVVYTLLRDKATLTEDGKVLIDGKTPEEAVKKLLEERSYLKKVSPKTGSGAGAPKTTEPKPASFEELLKDPQKLLEFKQKFPQEYEKLKAQYFEKNLRR